MFSVNMVKVLEHQPLGNIQLQPTFMSFNGQSCCQNLTLIILGKAFNIFESVFSTNAEAT